MEAAIEALARSQLALANTHHPFFRIWDSNPLTGDLTQDVMKWFEQFEYLAGLVEGITDATRLAELKKALKDRALSLVQGANNDQVDTYQHSKTFLQASLVYPHQTAIWRQQFLSRKKEESETVADYLRDLRTLVKRAYVGQGDEAQDLVLKERFVTGLQADPSHQNYKLWKAAYRNVGGTLNEVVAAVNAAEITQRMFSLQPSAIVTNFSQADVSNGLNAVMSNPARGQGMFRGGRGGRGGSSRPGSEARDGTAPTPQQLQQQNASGASNAGGQQRDQCQYDGVYGHKTEQCLTLATAKQRWANNEGRQCCHHCGDNRHIRATCRFYHAAKNRLSGQEPISLAEMMGNPNDGQATGTLPSVDKPSVVASAVPGLTSLGSTAPGLGEHTDPCCSQAGPQQTSQDAQTSSGLPQRQSSDTSLEPMGQTDPRLRIN